MKQLLLSLLLLPMGAMAQSTTQKVLQMSVVRTVGGTTKAYLSSDDDHLGPILNLQSDSLSLVTISGTQSRIALKRIKEIRFTVETVEVADAIASVTPDDESAESQRIYDLQGRRYEAGAALKRGIYIIGKKKIYKP